MTWARYQKDIGENQDKTWVLPSKDINSPYWGEREQVDYYSRNQETYQAT